jgi:hypothetical protein
MEKILFVSFFLLDHQFLGIRINGLLHSFSMNTFSASFIRFFSIIGLLLCSVFMFQTAGALKDVDSNDPSLEIYRHLSDIGVMTPDVNGLFRPDRLLSRAEGLKVALAAAGIVPQEASETQYFNDVLPDVWYAQYVETGLSINILTTESEFFYPQQAISKAEFLRWIFMATRVDLDAYKDGVSVALDVPYDSPYVREFRYAKKFNIAYIDSDDRYYPTEVVTRGVAANLLYRHLRVIHADEQTLQTIEMRSEIESFLFHVKAKQNDKAQLALINIQKIVDRMMRSRGEEDGVVSAFALSRSMEHFNTAMNSYQYNKNLQTFEYLLLASKQARRAESKGGDLSVFAKEFQEVIRETILEIT